MDNLDQEIFDINAAAEYLNCSTWVIRDMCKKHKLPYFKIGNMYRFRKIKLIEWMEKQEKINTHY